MTKPAIVTISELDELACRGHSLRQPCTPFEFGVDQIEPIAAQLRAAIRGHAVAVGFAAPQIGIDRRVVVINHKKKSLEHEKILINPEVVNAGGDGIDKYESCMSLPGWRARLTRSGHVTVRYLDESGVEQLLQAEGFLARILLHEIDHLDGVLFTDRLASLDDLERVSNEE